MEYLIVIAIFGISFFLLSIGVVLGKKQMHAGSCGSKLIVKGEPLSSSCACASKEAEVCPSGDKEGFATLAQLGNPRRKRVYADKHFSNN